MNKIIAQFITKTKQDDIEFKRNLALWGMDHELLRELFRSELAPKLRKAFPSDYIAWLKGYIKKGGMPQHYYDRPLDRDFYVATKDFKTLPLYGALSINIIIPSEINVNTSDGFGHCGLFFMNGFKNFGSVPIYNDTTF
jgi:hypothetical protein